MYEQYRTISRSWFSSLNACVKKHFTVCNNKSAVPEFPQWTMIVSIYYYSISDTYSFMFDSQLMIGTPYPKEKAINKMACSFYHCVFFFGGNIIIVRVLVLFGFMQSSRSCSSKYLFLHYMQFNSQHNLTNFLCGGWVVPRI